MAFAVLVLGWFLWRQFAPTESGEDLSQVIVIPQTDADVGEVGLYLENRGTTPAEITAFVIVLDDLTMDSWAAVTAKLAENRIQLFPNFEPPSRVPVDETLAPGQRIGLYTVPIESLNVFDFSAVKRLFHERLGIAVTYCPADSDCLVHCRNVLGCTSGPADRQPAY